MRRPGREDQLGLQWGVLRDAVSGRPASIARRRASGRARPAGRRPHRPPSSRRRPAPPPARSPSKQGPIARGWPGRAVARVHLDRDRPSVHIAQREAGQPSDRLYVQALPNGVEGGVADVAIGGGGDDRPQPEGPAFVGRAVDAKRVFGPRIWLPAVRCTNQMAPLHRFRSVFSLCRQTPVRQSWFSRSARTRTVASRSQPGLAAACAGAAAGTLASTRATRSAPR